MVAVWFAVTAGAERRPLAAPVLMIVPRFVLQVARLVTFVVVLLLQVAVAVYCDVVLSFTDAVPLIAMLVSVTAAGGGSAPLPGKVGGTALISVMLEIRSPSESKFAMLLKECPLLLNAAP